jgi:hypothetical protein
MEATIREFVERWQSAELGWYQKMFDRYVAMKDEPEFPREHKDWKLRAQLEQDFWKRAQIGWRLADKIKAMGSEYGRAQVAAAIAKEAERRIREFIAKITELTGPVQRFSLHIHAGEINGMVQGEKAIVRVNTISAGGYNIQRFHYRTLIKKSILYAE